MSYLDKRFREFHLQPPEEHQDFLPVPESELKQLEHKTGGRLPEDYRWFLKTYGESAFEIGVSCRTQDDITLPFGFFYGANDGGDDWTGCGVLENYKVHDGDFPEEMIPIGEDCLGNYFLIAGAGVDRGAVYYKDHELDCGTKSSTVYPGYERIAGSFTEFILGLEEDLDDPADE